MARQLETDSLSNQNISSALAVGAYTAAAARIVIVRLLVDQAAGEGDYIAYATVQVNGAGSHYRLLPITTAAAAAGVTALGFVSNGIPLDAGDVLTVYIDGLAGDTTTPDTKVSFYEHDYLRPTTADRTVDVDASGGVEVGSIANDAITAAAIAQNAIDADALAADVATEIAAGITIPTAATIADAVWDEAATGHVDAGKAGAQLWTDIDAILADTGTDGVIVASIANDAITAASIATDAITSDALASSAITEIGLGAISPQYGSGSETVTLGVFNGAAPIDGAAIWITSDVSGATIAAGTLYTDATGHATFYLDPGTYYVWKQHAGYNASNPEVITVTDE